jgi:hypothetical protein
VLLAGGCSVQFVAASDGAAVCSLVPLLLLSALQPQLACNMQRSAAEVVVVLLRHYCCRSGGGRAVLQRPDGAVLLLKRLQKRMHYVPPACHCAPYSA